MVHMATKMERQLIRKEYVWPAFDLDSSSCWKLNLRREGTVQLRSYNPSKTKPLKVKVEVPTGSKSKYET